MENAKKQMYLLLSKNKNSVLFLRPYKPVISRSDLSRLQKSDYAGDKKFLDLIKSNKPSTSTDVATTSKDDSEDVPTVIKRVFEPSNISTTLQQTWRPFMSVQADVAEFKFTRPSAADPSYVLVCVDLFSQKIFTYGFRTKNLLPKALKKFFTDIQKDREFFRRNDQQHGEYRQMRLQTDEEFTRNNKIVQLCKEHDVNLFTTYINGGHASAAEQKIKLIKERMTVYLQSGNFNKSNKSVALRDITRNLNRQIVMKYGYSPDELLSTFKKNPKEVLNYNSHRLVKVQKASARRDRVFEKKIQKKTTRLRKLVVGDLVFIPKGRVRKQDYPGRLDKITTNKKPFFNTAIPFKITSVFKDANESETLYTVKPVTEVPHLTHLETQKFVRDELYALKSNVVSHKRYNDKDDVTE